MRPIYIQSAVAISAQETFMSDTLLSEFINLVGTKREAYHPNYNDIISPSAGRRMATGVKMGVACALEALSDANLRKPEAVIIGTGMGCITDTEKFLNSIIDNDEEFLTPTSFIQSTHNTVAGKIALMLNCQGYNNTFVQASNSFESALLDAQLLLEADDAENVLVGGVDELGDEFINYVAMMEDKSRFGIKVPFSEGATFFVLSNSQKKASIQLVDIEISCKIESQNIGSKLKLFLHRNGLENKDIDVVVLGTNGDNFDYYYENATKCFHPEIPILDYKHFSGEYFTASAFGLWLGYTVLTNQNILKGWANNYKAEKKIGTVLLYNQFKGRDHSFILLRR